jgi:TolB-like protein/DNA-binding winged helix-turn-helix (wHTH) protein
MRFGIFELDEANTELRRAGVLIKLTPRQFRLLHFLVKNSGRVVTRDEIRQEVWAADTYVDFQRNLNVCIAQVRAAIDDDSESPRFIETVPRRGYRFVAPVTALSATPPPRLVRLAAPIGAALVCCALAALWLLSRTPARGPVRVAVLPFQSVADDAASAPFLDGLTGELISTLGSQNARLGVIGRASVMRFRRAAPDVPRLSRELHADYIVEGALREQADRMRLTASLIRASDQVQVWTTTVEHDRTESFQLQEEIAARVAAGVLQTIFPEATATIHPRENISGPAYQAYLDGRFLERQGTRQGLERSVGFFQDAIRQAPDFALAHSALAETWVAMARSGAAGSDGFAGARSAAESALRLDPGNAEAHNALANVLFWHDWNWNAAGREFDAAIAQNPSFALAHHDRAFFLVAVGRREEGLTALRQALALDPLSVRVNIDAGWLLLQARHFDEAIAQATRARQLEPGLREAEACISRAMLYQGRTRANMENPASFTDPFIRASFAALAGDPTQAFAALEQAYSSRSTMMVFLNTEPSFDKLRGDARFRALTAKMELCPSAACWSSPV